MSFFLKKVSKLYSSLMGVRSDLYERGILSSYKSRLPVISVGNISAGGTGKTPLCIFLAKTFSKKGRRPVILSRGYGGNYKALHVVSKNDEAKLCGDEPLLMAHSLDTPIVLCRDRIAGAKYIEQNDLGDLIILDDGLQHIRLKRDLDLVTIDVSNEKNINDMLHNKVIPWGHLREDRDAALARADFVVVSHRMPQSKAKAAGRELLKLIPGGKVIVSSYFEPKEIVSCADGSSLNKKEAVAFCGIANPEGFFATLETFGIRILHKVIVKDHHFFSTAEISEMRKNHPGAAFVCTEKDAMRISEENQKDIYKLRGELRIIPEDAFTVQIEKKLKSLN